MPLDLDTDMVEYNISHPMPLGLNADMVENNLSHPIFRWTSMPPIMLKIHLKTDVRFGFKALCLKEFAELFSTPPPHIHVNSRVGGRTTVPLLPWVQQAMFHVILYISLKKITKC